MSNADRRAVGVRGVAALALVASCAACSGNASGAGANAEQPGQDAGDAFGNSAGSSAAHEPPLTLIDDGGAGLLPDGAIVYLALRARPCPMDSALSYENFGQAFFASYCLRCHSAQRQGADRGGAPASLNYDELDAIRMRADAIWSVAADEHTLMPAAGTAPSSSERHLLGDWLACGAKSAMDVAAR